MLKQTADFIETCPYLGGQPVNVNYLDKGEASVSLEQLPRLRSVREYSDGGALKGQSFVIALNEAFGTGEEDSVLISQKCQSIEKWLEEQNLSGNLPVLGDGAVAVSLGVTKQFAPVRTNGISARYEAEIEVIYYNN